MRLEEQIQAEMKQHDDILLVDQVDIYRNLPDKLLKSLTWLQSTNTYPTHVLKTDDDCYLNIANIVKLLKTYSQQNFAMFAKYVHLYQFLKFSNDFVFTVLEQIGL